MELKIYHAGITHRHGENRYTDSTEEGLRAQLAEYCKDYWEEAQTAAEDAELTMPEDPAERISLYFQVMIDGECGEYLSYDDDVVAIPPPFDSVYDLAAALRSIVEQCGADTESKTFDEHMRMRWLVKDIALNALKKFVEPDKAP